MSLPIRGARIEIIAVWIGKHSKKSLLTQGQELKFSINTFKQAALYRSPGGERELKCRICNNITGLPKTENRNMAAAEAKAPAKAGEN